MKFINAIAISLLFISTGFSQLEYSFEDMNTTSPSYGQDVWNPFYTEYITFHYISTQG